MKRLTPSIFCVFHRAGSPVTGLQAHPETFQSKPVTLIVPWPAGGRVKRHHHAHDRRVDVQIAWPARRCREQAGRRRSDRSTRDRRAASPTAIRSAYRRNRFLPAAIHTPTRSRSTISSSSAGSASTPRRSTANASTGWTSLSDFVTAAKAKPGSIRNGNDQPGGTSFSALR